MKGWAKVDDLETGSLKLIGSNPSLTVKDSTNLETDNAFQAKYAGLDSASTEVFELGDYNGSAQEIGFNAKTANYSLVFGTNDTERMRIDDAGLVGIGTNNPTFPIHAVYNSNGVNFDRTDADHLSQDVLRLKRSRSDATPPPNADFGPSMVFVLEGNTNGQEFEGARIKTGWEIDQVDNTAARDTYMSFETAINNGATSEAMRIDSAGNVGIGTTTPDTLLEVTTSSTTDQDPILKLTSGENRSMEILQGYGSSGAAPFTFSTNNAFNFNIDGVDVLTMAASGSNVGIGDTTPSQKLDVNGNIAATAYFYNSDRRLKENIKTVDNALSKVLNLRGVKFDWKESGETTYGFIAQEVEKVLPELIFKDNEGWLSVQYGNIIAPIIEAIKEQQDIIVRNKDLFKMMHFGLQEQVNNNTRMIASLKKENKELKSKMSQLEKDMAELKELIKNINKK